MSHNPAFFAERRQHRLTNGNAGIFGGVVLIDMQIANRLYGQINQRVPRQLLEHMIEKADPCRNIILARAVEIDRNIDRCFMGLAADITCAHGGAIRSLAVLASIAGLN
jgi:hypothetical protein